LDILSLNIGRNKMPPLKYHPGQLQIQAEANTTEVAGKLAFWVGPIIEFISEADLILLAFITRDGLLRFSVLSGKPPLVESIAVKDGVHFRFLLDPIYDETSSGYYGGLAISMANARRVRINGQLIRNKTGTELAPKETFTLCKKYIAPTIAIGDQQHLGPATRDQLSINDPWLKNIITKTETAFLASASPDEKPDVAHRGGPPGFLNLDTANQSLSWQEFVGDGIFKSAGNIRCTNKFTLLVPDFESGDGIEITGQGVFHNLRFDKKERADPLVKHKEDFPIQGIMNCNNIRAFKLTGLLNPRKRLDKAIRITSKMPAWEQAPQ
jgi:hypothetical protein